MPTTLLLALLDFQTFRHPCQCNVAFDHITNTVYFFFIPSFEKMTYQSNWVETFTEVAFSFLQKNDAKNEEMFRENTVAQKYEYQYVLQKLFHSIA